MKIALSIAGGALGLFGLISYFGAQPEIERPSEGAPIAFPDKKDGDQAKAAPSSGAISVPGASHYSPQPLSQTVLATTPAATVTGPAPLSKATQSLKNVPPASATQSISSAFSPVSSTSSFTGQGGLAIDASSQQPPTITEEEFVVPSGAKVPAALFESTEEATPALTEKLDQIADEFLNDVSQDESLARGRGEATPAPEAEWQDKVEDANALHRSIVGFQNADRAERLAAMDAMGVKE